MPFFVSLFFPRQEWAAAVAVGGGYTSPRGFGPSQTHLGPRRDSEPFSAMSPWPLRDGREKGHAGAGDATSLATPAWWSVTRGHPWAAVVGYFALVGSNPATVLICGTCSCAQGRCRDSNARIAGGHLSPWHRHPYEQLGLRQRRQLPSCPSPHPWLLGRLSERLSERLSCRMWSGAVALM